MNKRLFLQALVASGGVALVAQRLLRPASSPAPPAITPPQPPVPATPAGPDLPVSDPQEEFELVMLQENELHPGFKHSERVKSQEVVIE